MVAVSRKAPASLRPRWWPWLVVPIVLLPMATALWWLSASNGGAEPAAAQRSPQRYAPIDPERAFRYLVDICRLGSRTSGSAGMQNQQRLLTQHFERLGGEVERQDFTARHPMTGRPVPMANLMVRWFPQRKQRILLAAHYDTRPFPDQDPINPTGLFIGANDGASGVALMMELAHHMASLESKTQVGIDFVLFDGEELVFDNQRDPYFLGSTFFAEQYVSDPPPYVYQAGVLVDMIGDRDLQLYMEVNSLRLAPQLTTEIWEIARDLKIREFVARPGPEVRDDHLPLNEIAKIPTTNIIDFYYPAPSRTGPNYWHTQQDTPDKCSGLSLAKVGVVVMEWFRRVVPETTAPDRDN